MSTINADAIKAAMVDYLVERAGVQRALLARGDAPLSSLGVDSLATVEMLWELEEKFGVHIEDLSTLPGMTLDELALFVSSAEHAAS